MKEPTSLCHHAASPNGRADPASGTLTPGYGVRDVRMEMVVLASALDLGHRLLPTAQALPAGRSRGYALPLGPRGKAVGDSGIALGRSAPHCSCDLIAKELVLSNTPQVLGGYTAASRVSGTSTFFPRRVSFSHSLMFKWKCFTSDGHKMEQTCFSATQGRSVPNLCGDSGRQG